MSATTTTNGGAMSTPSHAQGARGRPLGATQVPSHGTPNNVGSHGGVFQPAPPGGNPAMAFLAGKIKALLTQVQTEQARRTAAEVRVAELEARLVEAGDDADGTSRDIGEASRKQLETSNKELRDVNAELLGHCEHLQDALKKISEAYRQLHNERHNHKPEGVPPRGGKYESATPDDLRQELQHTKQQLRASQRRMVAAEKKSQELEKECKALTQRSISLQQRLDALRNRNSQLTTKQTHLQRKLERSSGAVAKVEALTLELAATRSRLQHTQRHGKPSPTSELQGYVKATQAARLAERNRELEHKLASLSALHHQMLTTLAPVLPPPVNPYAQSVLSQRDEETDQAGAAYVAPPLPPPRWRTSPVPTNAHPRLAPSPQPVRHEGGDVPPQPRVTSPVPMSHPPHQPSPPSTASTPQPTSPTHVWQSNNGSRDSDDKMRPPPHGAAVHTQTGTRPVPATSHQSPREAQGRTSPLRIRGPARDVQGIKAYLKRERARLRSAKLQDKTGDSRSGHSNPQRQPAPSASENAGFTASVSRGGNSRLRLSDLENPASGGHSPLTDAVMPPFSDKLSPQQQAAKASLLASQSSEVFDDAVRATERALRSSFTSDAKVQGAGGASLLDDDDAGHDGNGDGQDVWGMIGDDVVIGENGSGGEAPPGVNDGTDELLAASAMSLERKRRWRSQERPKSSDSPRGKPFVQVAGDGVAAGFGSGSSGDFASHDNDSSSGVTPNAQSARAAQDLQHRVTEAAEAAPDIRPVRPKFGTLDDF